ncbi:MAG: 16S rRNA (cytidine(1402)-2'-O)-methyltransferase [Candidatus Dadabacteria bacterium]|nr:MAG: 16S rRNA (cytidine(1402)-2'-O)-methyltransferase [Candidatus Dadabacteria bacterium]TDJ01668.1 MAG: 16S rRNA (cytidine(1402)-2'-O)-methyltransferase [Candidatus Dadabacteria bacterium]
MSSKLYIVSTPIGNLEDITLRALNVLKQVDLIACEDTRTTKKLLSRYQILKPLTSYHEHNEIEKAKELLSMLQEGHSIALVTDAGTPGVSDPGYRIVKLASENGVQIFSVPGPSAAIAALSISGLPTSGFTFLGFPPKQKKRLIEYLERIKDYPETLVFYESPRRVIKTLESMAEVFGERNASLGREITKMYEETLRGTLSEIVTTLKSRDNLKGEFTLVIEGNSQDKGEFDSDTIDDLLLYFKKEGVSLKDAVKQVAVDSGVSKSKIYKKALQIWE